MSVLHPTHFYLLTTTPLQLLRDHLYYQGVMGAFRPEDLPDDTVLPTNLQGQTLWIDRTKDGVSG